MESIERKTLLYRSGLGFWCINHVQGCSHGCRYPCYAFMMGKHHGRVSSMAEWCKPRIVGNALALLQRDLRRKKGLDCVHLCLTTDPFMVGHPEVTSLSLQLIEAINRAGIPCSLLTKGILPPDLADERRFLRGNVCGISVVSADEGFRRQWEPGASPYAERVAAARYLHEQGVTTLAHVEPYPTPNVIVQDVHRVLEQVEFVDSLWFSGWNYNREVGAFAERDAFYERQTALVRRFCRARGISFEGG